MYMKKVWKEDDESTFNGQMRLVHKRKLWSSKLEFVIEANLQYTNLFIGLSCGDDDIENRWTEITDVAKLQRLLNIHPVSVDVSSVYERA